MAEFIVNPRRAPRAPARCRAAVVSPQGWFEAETEDIGSMGCQLVSPKLVRKGDIVQLHVTNEKILEPLKVVGRVAWVSAQPPWRVGISFDEASHAEGARWFELLISAYPGMGGYRRVPDRIRADATVYLGPPPKFLVDFSGEEAMLLRAIASGARIDELQARLRHEWPRAQRALFSLIARQAITFQRGQAVHPDSWKKILSEVESSLALEEMGKSSATLVAPPAPPPAERSRPARAEAPSATPVPELARPGATAAWVAVQPYDPSRQIELAPDDATPLEVAAPERGLELETPAGQAGWRSRGRSPDAQAAFDRGVAELRMGSASGALEFFRRAISLAPGDPEIEDALGKLGFYRDRTPGRT